MCIHSLPLSVPPSIWDLVSLIWNSAPRTWTIINWGALVQQWLTKTQKNAWCSHVSPHDLLPRCWAEIRPSPTPYWANTHIWQSDLYLRKQSVMSEMHVHLFKTGRWRNMGPFDTIDKKLAHMPAVFTHLEAYVSFPSHRKCRTWNCLLSNNHLLNSCRSLPFLGPFEMVRDANSSNQDQRRNL